MRVRTYVTAAMSMAIGVNCAYAEERAGVHLASTEIVDAHASLQAKLQELNRLQDEIADLRDKTNSQEQILVKVKMLEVNLTKLHQRGFEYPQMIRKHFQGTDTSVKSIGGIGFAPAGADEESIQMAIANKSIHSVFDSLARQNLGKVLAEPQIAVLNGRPSSLNVGGEFPVPLAEGKGVEFRKYGTRLDVTATSIGNNRVRLEVRPRVSELDTNRTIKVGEHEIPGLFVREIDTAAELESGQAWVISGLVRERVVCAKTDSGTREDVEKFALVLMLEPEIVR